MVFGSNISIYKIVFMAELLIAESLFFSRLTLKKNFWLPITLSLIVCFAAAFFFPVNAKLNSPLYVSFMFFFLFALTLTCSFFIFDEKPVALIFCSIAGYCTQHVAFQCFNILAYSTEINDNTALGIYGNDLSPVFTLYAIPLYVICYFAAYWLVYLLCSLRIKGQIFVKSAQVLVLLVLTVLVSVVINAVTTYHSYDAFDKLNVIMTSISIFVCCALVLTVQFSFLLSTDLQNELERVNGILREERRQYVTSKETIELINIKCHDLKYKIRLISGGGMLDDKKVDEIEKTISIYDSFVETGNAALDLAVTEKGLVCNGKKINFSCILDGKKLSFIDETDIYTLFCNALDNAIEASMKCEEEKRVISLTSHFAGGRLIVVCRNYYSDQPILDENGFKTTKEDKRYHGYGVKSIKRIVSLYGGKTEISADEGVFTLTMIFPLST